MRDQFLHSSGLTYLSDVPVSEELASNMAGRCSREQDGLVTYLYDFDDSAEAFAHCDLKFGRSP